MLTHSFRAARSVVITSVVLLGLWLPARAERSAPQVPPSVAGLLPSAAQLTSGNWGVLDSEFGKTFSADMTATLPGRRLSCDSTDGPMVTISLKGDTAFEAPPMLDMAVQGFNADMAKARTGVPARLAALRAGNTAISSASALKEERLPNGHLLYLDYAESCADYGNGTNSMLRGFARKGARMLTFDLRLSASGAEAATLGKEMLARFEKFNVTPLLK
ncbi:MAG: hypothetical protein ABI603_02155 [Acidobacteriota bacterium]